MTPRLQLALWIRVILGVEWLTAADAHAPGSTSTTPAHSHWAVVQRWCSPRQYLHCPLNRAVAAPLVTGSPNQGVLATKGRAFYCYADGSCRCCLENRCGTKAGCAKVVDDMRKPLAYFF